MAKVRKKATEERNSRSRRARGERGGGGIGRGRSYLGTRSKPPIPPPAGGSRRGGRRATARWVGVEGLMARAWTAKAPLGPTAVQLPPASVLLNTPVPYVPA